MRAVIADLPKHWLAERKNSDAARWDEYWDGVLHMPPAPNVGHQDFEGQLATWLRVRWARPLGNKVYQQINVALPDEPEWTLNYRIPDVLLLTPDRFHINRGTYFAGAPLVVVEIKSPGDETYEKFPFYANLGVPEVWVFDRDTKAPEIHELAEGQYRSRSFDADGWLRSPASGVEFRQAQPGKVRIRVNGNDATAEELPDD